MSGIARLKLRIKHPFEDKLQVWRAMGGEVGLGEEGEPEMELERHMMGGSNSGRSREKGETLRSIPHV